MYYTDVITFVQKSISAVAMLAVTILLIPWLKSVAIPWLKEKRLYDTIKHFVRAAEKMGDTGAIPKGDKLAYVIKLLEGRGVKVTDEVRAMIESAVGDLDDMLSVIVDEFVNEKDD